jgi:hypothetical protein
MSAKPSKRSALLLSLVCMALPPLLFWRDVGANMMTAGGIEAILLRGGLLVGGTIWLALTVVVTGLLVWRYPMPWR